MLDEFETQLRGRARTGDAGEQSLSGGAGSPAPAPGPGLLPGLVLFVKLSPASGSGSSGPAPVDSCRPTPSVTPGAAVAWHCSAAGLSFGARRRQDRSRKRELRRSRPGSSSEPGPEARWLARAKACRKVARPGRASPRWVPGAPTLPALPVSGVFGSAGSLGLCSSGPEVTVRGDGILTAGELEVKERIRRPGGCPALGSRQGNP